MKIRALKIFYIKIHFNQYRKDCMLITQPIRACGIFIYSLNDKDNDIWLLLVLIRVLELEVE